MIFIREKKLSPPEKWIILGIPFLFIIGSIFHFLYQLSGERIIIGIIAPVNESVWEHLKMILIPTICWWAIYYVLRGYKYKINANKWFTGLLVSLVSSMFTIMFVFYFYTEAFGVELIIVDILILLLANIVGQLLGLHFYRYATGIDVQIAIVIIVFIVTVFIVFTFNPPHLPLFLDSSTGTYGI